MSLKQLLEVGGSLQARRGVSGKYRMASRGVLPKFEIVRGTIRAVPMDGVVPSGAGLEERSPGPLFEAPVNQVTSVLTAPAETPPTPSTVIAGNPFKAGVVARSKTSVWQKLRSGAADLRDMLLSKLRRRQRARPFSSAVQPELRLDAVKPLRNDLSDSDFEVVPVQVPKPVTPLVLKDGSKRSMPDGFSSAVSARKTPLSRWAGQLLGAKD
jgi:hypothetical protein